MTEQEKRQALLAKKAKVVRVLAFTLAAFLSVAVGLTLVTILLQNRQLDSQGKILVECTTPPEARTPPNHSPGPDDCYIRNQKSTADILANVNRVSVAAAACGADHPGDIAATRVCVRAAIQRMVDEVKQDDGK